MEHNNEDAYNEYYHHDDPSTTYQHHQSSYSTSTSHQSRRRGPLDPALATQQPVSYRSSESAWLPETQSYETTGNGTYGGTESARFQWRTSHPDSHGGDLSTSSRNQLLPQEYVDSHSTSYITEEPVNWDIVRPNNDHLQVHYDNLRLLVPSSSPGGGSTAPVSPTGSVSDRVYTSDVDALPMMDPTAASSRNHSRRQGASSRRQRTSSYETPSATYSSAEQYNLSTAAGPGPSLESPSFSDYPLPPSEYLAPTSEDFMLFMPESSVLDSGGNSRRLMAEQQDWSPDTRPTSGQFFMMNQHEADLQQSTLAASGTGGQPKNNLGYHHHSYSVSDGYTPSVATTSDQAYDEPQESLQMDAHLQGESSLPSNDGQSKQSGMQSKVLRCTYANCSSKVVFTRQCDLAKHYRQHFRRFQCRVEGCKASAGFATKKDRVRHERTHNPSILCETCGRKFSRLDNLRDHIRRRHRD